MMTTKKPPILRDCSMQNPGELGKSTETIPDFFTNIQAMNQILGQETPKHVFTRHSFLWTFPLHAKLTPLLETRFPEMLFAIFENLRLGWNALQNITGQVVRHLFEHLPRLFGGTAFQ